jgi:hypothetical protein
MIMSIISSPYFWDEPAAHAKLEEIVWPNGPVCMRCGATDRIGAVTGKGARAGLKFCCRCRKQFRATIGTMFEGSHVPLHKWFQACFLLNAAGGAVSAHQLHLRLEVTNKTALGIVQRLAAVIKSVGCTPPNGGLSGPSRTLPVGSAHRALRRQPRGAPGAIGWDELPWMKFPTQPRRQFLRFAETVRALGYVEDEAGFGRLLATIGTHGKDRTPENQGPVSGVKRAHAFAGRAGADHEHAAA